MLHLARERRIAANISAMDRMADEGAAVYDKLYVMPHNLRIEWRDAVDRLRTAQSLFHQARKYPEHYGIVGVNTARKGVLHAMDDLWGVQSRVELVKE